MHATTVTTLLQPSRSGRRQPHVQSPLIPSGKSNGMENAHSIFVSTCCYHRYQAQRRSRCYQCWQEDFNDDDMFYAGVEFVFSESGHSYRQHTVIYIQDDCSATASARRYRSNSSEAQYLLLIFLSTFLASYPSSHQLTYSPTRHF